MRYETIPSQEYVVNYNEEYENYKALQDLGDIDDAENADNGDEAEDPAPVDLNIRYHLVANDDEPHIAAFQTLENPQQCTFASFELWVKDNFLDNTRDANQFREYDPGIHDALQFNAQTAELTVITNDVFDYIVRIKANMVEGSYIYSNEFYVKSGCAQESYKISIPDRIV